MNIDNKLVDYLTMLSRLNLSDEEKQVIIPQLKDIVNYVEKLGSLDVENIPPMDHVLDVKDVYREDKAATSCSREEILKNAPSTDGAFFKVPKIL